MQLSDAQVMEVARRQVSLTFLLATLLDPVPVQAVRTEVLSVFTRYWNRELPYADLQAELDVSGLPEEFLRQGVWLYLNAEDVN